MTLFDLLFLVSAVAAAISLVAAAISILRGRWGRALRLLKFLTLYTAAYFVMAGAVDILKPQRVIGLGQPWCFDDWCMQVDGVSHSTNGTKVRYTTQLRVFSTARGISQRARGAWIYLIDTAGHRFPPHADAAATPLTVMLAPEQSVLTSRVFEVPADAHIIGLITGHGGSYCGWGVLIIGEGGCLLNRPTMVRIP